MCAFREQGLAHDENAVLGEVLEAAAASTLREITYHPPLVGMLLRRCARVYLATAEINCVVLTKLPFACW